MSELVKSCACGRTFTREAWLALPFLGVGFYEVDDGRELVQESRNCPCGSTLARNVAETPTRATAAGRWLELYHEHTALVEVVRAFHEKAQKERST